MLCSWMLQQQFETKGPRILRVPERDEASAALAAAYQQSWTAWQVSLSFVVFFAALGHLAYSVQISRST